MLTKVLTGRVIPPGQDCLSAGVAIVDAATCWAVYRWVACGQPCTHRVVTVSGSRVGRPGNFLLPFGTDAHELLAALQTRGHGPVIYGPAMTGEAMPAGAAVGCEASLLLAERLDPPGAPTPCIRCGWCGDYCPARLNVSALNDDFELGRADRADRRGVLACVECGVCSYVCPARLPLARRMLLLKQAIGRKEFSDATNAEIRNSKS
jgi:Na+-translocating ferredoxin:NAD+ oxidoreductase subunit C